MRARRRSALHEAGHAVAFLEGGLGPVEARLDPRGGFTRCSPPDRGTTEGEVVGSLAGYYVELFVDPEHRELARRRAGQDLASFRAMVAAKHRGRDVARHSRRYRAQARQLVARRFSEIYVLARELEARGRLGPERAEGLMWAVGEVRRRRANNRRRER